MQFALGVLSCLSVVLVVMLVLGRKAFLRNLRDMQADIADVRKDVRLAIADLVLTRNIIHLGLGPVKVGPGVELVRLPINPEDFKVRAEKLEGSLLRELETAKHPDIDTRAYCILSHSGLDALLDSESNRGLKKSLVRLLINGDNERTREFLCVVANSVATATSSAISETDPV